MQHHSRRWAITLFTLILIGPVPAGLGPAAGAAPKPPAPSSDPSASPPNNEGWRPATPLGFIAVPRVDVKAAPESRARMLYFLKGGDRVPILEQNDAWWKVRGPGKPAGWIRAGQVQPHSTLVLLDLEHGRFFRRIATMGEGGPLVDWTRGWAYASAKSGPALSRTPLQGERRTVSLASIPVDTPLSGVGILEAGPDRLLAALEKPEDRETPFSVVDLRRGTGVRRFTFEGEKQGYPIDRGDRGLAVLDAGVYGPVRFISGDGQEIRRFGTSEDRVIPAEDGSLWILGPLKAKPTLTLKRIAPDGSLRSIAALPAREGFNYAISIFSTEGRDVFVSVPRRGAEDPRNGESPTELRVFDRETGTLLHRYPWSGDDPPQIVAATSRFLYAYDPGESKVWQKSIDTAKTLRTFPMPHANPESIFEYQLHGDRLIYEGDNELLVRGLSSGAIVERIPMTWRPPGYLQYTPFQIDDDGKKTTIHSPLTLSSIQVSPDGKRALVTEFLDGDDGG